MIENGTYRHWKGGLYEVVDCAVGHQGQWWVVYKNDEDVTFARTLEDFEGEPEPGVRRFVKL